MKSDIEKIQLGRTSEDGFPYPVLPDGRHIRGGLNMSASAIRYNDEHDVCYRPDLANLLDTWIVDMNEAARYLREKENVDMYRRIMGSVRTSLLTCLRQISSKVYYENSLRTMNSSLSFMYKPTMIFSKVENTCFRPCVQDCLKLWLWLLNSAESAFSKKDVRAMCKAEQRLHESMLEVFFEITEEKERSIFRSGEILH